MKASSRFLCSTLICITSATSAGAAVLVDDFSDLTLTEYTQTRVLDNLASEVNISFSAASGALNTTYSGGNAAEQVVLLRDDYTLAIGQTLTVDVSQATTTSDLDFGIAVASTKTPTSIVNGGDTDTRDTMQWAAVYIRPNQNSVRSLSYDGAALVSGTGVLTADETAVAKLWIKRDSATSFSLGYTNTSDVSFTSKSVTLSSNVGNAIGFYADLRVNGGALGSLDNLSIVPEPSAAALAGLAALGLAFRRRRC